jgi:hypothetical protein
MSEISLPTPFDSPFASASYWTERSNRAKSRIFEPWHNVEKGGKQTKRNGRDKQNRNAFRAENLFFSKHIPISPEDVARPHAPG